MEPLPEEDRNKFVVAGGAYEDVGHAERGPKVQINWEYVEYFDTLHDAIHTGLPKAKGKGVIELAYVDQDGYVWELDIAKQS